MGKIKSMFNNIKKAVTEKWEKFQEWREATKEKFEEWSEEHPTLGTMALAAYYSAIYVVVFWVVFYLLLWMTVKFALWTSPEEVAE